MNQSNVLLIVLDAVRKDHLSPYGHEESTTPTLEHLASEATQFDQAIAAAPWTPPSHASIFSGQYPSRHKVYGVQSQLSPETPVIADELSKAGYETIGFSNSYHTSVDRGFDRGFDFYHDLLDLPQLHGHMVEPSLDFIQFAFEYLVTDHDASKFQSRKLKTQLAQQKDPFIAFINFNSAHSPYRPPERLRERFEEDFDRWDEVDQEKVREITHNAGDDYMMDNLSVTDAEWELAERWYDAEIAYLDELLGDLFQFLRDQDLYQDTTIVVTSDHGEHFGEHGLAYHKFSLSEILINVPLLIKWPASVDESPGQISNELVSLVDLAPTFLDLADRSIPNEMQGRSLLSDESPPEAVFAEYGGPPEPLRERLQHHDAFDQYDRGLQAVRTGEHKLVRTDDDESNLYRIGDLTEERIPIDDNKDIYRELDQLLDDTLQELPSDSSAEVEELDEQTREHLKEMGYI